MSSSQTNNYTWNNSSMFPSTLVFTTCSLIHLFVPIYIMLILKMRLKHESKRISRITPSKSYCLSQLE